MKLDLLFSQYILAVFHSGQKKSGKALTFILGSPLKAKKDSGRVGGAPPAVKSPFKRPPSLSPSRMPTAPLGFQDGPRP